MKKVTFYFLDSNIIDINQFYIKNIICNFISNKWRNGKEILIICENDKQAIILDEILWIFNSNSFIPHNLSNKILKKETPIEIGWSNCFFNINRDILINLLPSYINFANIFYEIIDFIPNGEKNKQLARKRYIKYKKAGFKLTIVPYQTY